MLDLSSSEVRGLGLEYDTLWVYDYIQVSYITEMSFYLQLFDN